MAQKGNTAFQEVFAMASSMESLKLLPWCISSAVPSHYISEALVTTTWTGQKCPSHQCCTWTRGVNCFGAFQQSSSSFWNYCCHHISFSWPSLYGHSPIGTPTCWVPIHLHTEKGDCSPSGSLDHHCNKRTCIDSKEVKARSDHSCTQGDKNMPELVPEAGPSSEQWEQEPASPPSNPTRAIADPWWQNSCRKLTEYWGSSLFRLQLAKGECGWLWHGHSLQRLHYMLRHRRGVCMNCSQEVPKEVSLWIETQLKRISENCQDVWEHDHECVGAEQKCTLVGDGNSFEM